MSSLAMMRKIQVRSINVTHTALLALVLGAACSQSGEGQGEATSALTPVVAPPTTGAPAPVGTPPSGAVSPATGGSASNVAPSSGGVSPATGDSSGNVTPSTDAVPPASMGSSDQSEAPDGTDTGSDSEQTTNECEPAPPPVEACTDNINEDEPDLPCSQWVEWGTCDESWMIERHVCDRSCGRCTGDEMISAPPVNTCNEPSGTDTPPTSTMETPPPVKNEGPTLPPIEGGQDGFTTRYWDCCKPHCGWPGNAGNPISSCDQSNANMGGNYDAASACNGGPAHMCWNFVPQTNGDNIAFAYAAHNGVGCGTCFQLDFTGESKNPKPDTGHDFGSQSLKNKSMIVQVINTGGIEPGQFDLLVPGGGVGEFNACSAQWGGADLGEQYGGFFLACQKEHDFEYEPSRQCAREWCDSVFSDKPELHAGCSWFVEWFALADNPTMKYKEVACPPELSSISGL